MPRPRRASRLATVAGAWSFAVRGLYDAVSSTLGACFGMTGTYAVLDPRRDIMPKGWQAWLQRNYSANELSQLSLPQLRSLCRKMERDNCTARAIVEGLVAQTVGSGIGLEPDTGVPAVDKAIRPFWIEWCRGCDVTGRRSIFSMQSEAMREWCVAGSHVWRMVVLPERAAAGLVPLVILPLDSEWLAAGLPPSGQDGITRIPGIDLDKLGRPVTYHLINPEMLGTGTPEIVPADQVIHGFEHRRPLQNQGEPILTPTIERLFQEGQLVDAELKAAVNCAGMAVVVTSEYQGDTDTTSQGSDRDPAQDIAVGAIARMFPGETVQAFSHNRPSQQIAPFRTTLRGDQAGACRISQRWLDRDYSRASYSSMRADNLDSDRLHGPLTEDLGHSTIGECFVRVFPYLCALAGVVKPKRAGYRLIPDGQAYVDPQKDAMASALAIAFGLSDYETEIGRKGGDYREVWRKLAKQRAEAKAMDLELAAPGGTDAAIPAEVDDEPVPAANDANGEPIKPPADQKKTTKKGANASAA